MPNSFAIPFIQVAGVKSIEEAAMLMSRGVEYLGFPLRLDVHAPDTSEEEAAKIIRSIQLPRRAVLITYLNNAHEIEKFMQVLGIRALQIHGGIGVGELNQLRARMPDILIIKSLVVSNSNAAALEDCVRTTSPFVDAFITDTFDPATGAKGATGKTHDWSISRRLVEISSKPVILAGGLNPKNVAEAIRTVSPAGVDVHTGVENSRGNKDPALVKEFVAAARSAFAKSPPLKSF